MGPTVLQGELDVGWGWYEGWTAGGSNSRPLRCEGPKASDGYSRMRNDFAAIRDDALFSANPINTHRIAYQRWCRLPPASCVTGSRASTRGSLV